MNSGYIFEKIYDSGCKETGGRFHHEFKRIELTDEQLFKYELSSPFSCFNCRNILAGCKPVDDLGELFWNVNELATAYFNCRMPGNVVFFYEDMTEQQIKLEEKNLKNLLVRNGMAVKYIQVS
jgi:hypothetical protein